MKILRMEGNSVRFFACLLDTVSDGVPDKIRLAEIIKLGRPLMMEVARLREIEMVRFSVAETPSSPGDSFKVIGTDNLARDTVSDFLWLDQIGTLEDAERIASRLNKGLGNEDATYYRAVPHHHVLHRYNPC